jgi:hypothetical protein
MLTPPEFTMSRAVADEEIAVLVEIADIAECHEAVAPDLKAFFIQAVIGEIGNALEPKVNITHRTRGQGSAIGIVDPDRATGQWPPDGAGFRERFLGGRGRSRRPVSVAP